MAMHEIEVVELKNGDLVARDAETHEHLAQSHVMTQALGRTVDEDHLRMCARAYEALANRIMIGDERWEEAARQKRKEIDDFANRLGIGE